MVKWLHAYVYICEKNNWCVVGTSPLRRMGSFCENPSDDFWTIHPTEYNIIEVAEVQMPDGATWMGTQDHSKWVRVDNIK